MDAAGYVLTNNHVVEGAEEVSVELSDRRRLEAKIVGTDPPSDLAVLKIEAENLPNLPLGDSDAARVGDVVLAFGNPLGVGQTVTMGILSAKGRATGANSDGYEDFLQTDAPINRGNSGGPLVNLRGEIVGINTQIVSPSGGNIGIGFSIPANMARHVMDQLVEHGAVRRGLLGVTVQGVSADLARSLGLQEVQGALVSSVQPGSAGDRAGIERGDVITRLNDEPVRDSNGLRNAIAGTDPGTSVKLTVVRDGASRELTATLDELQPTARRGGRSSGGGPAESRYGLSVRPVTPELAGRFDLDAANGLLVTGVDPAGVAARAGLREGDVILEVDRQAVSTADELRSALDASGDTPALVLVLRESATLFLAVPQPAER